MQESVRLWRSKTDDHGITAEAVSEYLKARDAPPELPGIQHPGFHAALDAGRGSSVAGTSTSRPRNMARYDAQRNVWEGLLDLLEIQQGALAGSLVGNLGGLKLHGCSWPTASPATPPAGVLSCTSSCPSVSPVDFKAGDDRSRRRGMSGTRPYMSSRPDLFLGAALQHHPCCF